jgi:tetratricopeptide (TPR) repeat protein
MVTAKESSFRFLLRRAANALIFALVLYCAGFFAFSGPGVRSVEAAQLKRYTVSDGLASDTITAMASDKKGNLWAGTIDGAASFNGEKWEKYTVENGCLKDNAVWAVGVDEGDGYSKVWFGTGFGLAVIENGHWTHYVGAHENPKTKKKVDGNCPLSSNVINKIFVVKDSKNNRNNILIVAGGKLYKYNGEKWSTFDFPRDILKTSSITAMHAKNGDCVWFGTSGSGVVEFDMAAMKITTYTKKEGLPSDYVTAVYAADDGRVWVGSENGLGIMENGNCVVYNYRNSKLVSDYVTGIEKVFYGNLVVATDKGINLHDGKGFLPLPALLGALNGRLIWSLNYSAVADVNYSQLWLGTRGFGLYSYKVAKDIKENQQEDMTKLAIENFNKQFYEQSVKNWDEVLALEPGNKDAMMYKARCFLKMQKPAQAQETLKTVISKNPDLKEAILLLGESYEAVHDYKQAVKAYDNLVIQYPKETDGFVLCARVLLKMNNFDDAVSYYTKALTINTELPSIYKGLARCFIAKNNLSKALDISLQLQYRKPDDVENNVQIARIYSSLHKYAEAEEELKKVLAADENNSSAKAILGLVSFEKGDLKEAEKNLSEALAVNFKDANAHALLALVHIDNDKIELARGELANARFVDAYEVLISYAEGRILELEGNFNEAIAYYNQAINTGYNTAAVHYRIANSLKSLEKYDEALREYHKVLALDPAFKKADDVKWIISKLTMPTDEELGGPVADSSGTASSSGTSGTSSATSTGTGTRPTLDDLDF